MKRKIIYTALVAISAGILLSCSKDETVQPAPQNYLKVSEAFPQDSSYTLELFANDSLFVGYNTVYFRITNKSDGQPVKQATLAMHPLMDMMTFTHACPYEDPSGNANSQGYFQGAVLFSMPGVNTWSIDVDVTALGKSESLHFALAKVIATTPARKIVVIDSLEGPPGTWTITKYPISLVRTAGWQVGNNPFEITIHRMASMMSFPPVSDMTVEITPEMPSMGHGSPNNVNPVHTGTGHYAGTVNFTMTGDWRIHLTLKSGSRLISDKAYFDITF